MKAMFDRAHRPRATRILPIASAGAKPSSISARPTIRPERFSPAAQFTATRSPLRTCAATCAPELVDDILVVDPGHVVDQVERVGQPVEPVTPVPAAQVDEGVDLDAWKTWPPPEMPTWRGAVPRTVRQRAQHSVFISCTQRDAPAPTLFSTAHWSFGLSALAC